MQTRKRVIKSNEHVFLAGRTGSGKTYLARKYLARYPEVVVLDTKGKFTWPEVPAAEKTLITSLEKLSKQTKAKIVYRPNWKELDAEWYDAFFEWIYNRQNTICYIDEAMQVCPNVLTIPKYYKALLTRGRELGIGVWTASQRPKDLPQVVMSEATHFFAFDLNLPQDRRKIMEITGCGEFWTKPPKFASWYYNQDEGTSPILVKCVNNLKKEEKK